jgi:hypothetical protein
MSETYYYWTVELDRLGSGCEHGVVARTFDEAREAAVEQVRKVFDSRLDLQPISIVRLGEVHIQVGHSDEMIDKIRRICKAFDMPEEEVDTLCGNVDDIAIQSERNAMGDLARQILAIIDGKEEK